MWIRQRWLRRLIRQCQLSGHQPVFTLNTTNDPPRNELESLVAEGLTYRALKSTVNARQTRARPGRPQANDSCRTRRAALNDQRLREAFDLVCFSDTKIEAIPALVGLTRATFFRLFQKQMGLSPTRLRRVVRGGETESRPSETG